MTSPASSTTQITEESRRSSAQIVQRGPSATLKQISQNPIFSLTSRIASASALASSGSARRMWNASRCAVRAPTPGSLPSSVTSRWIGGANKLEARQAEAAEVQPAGQAAHLARGELLRRAQALVDRGEHHVLQELRVVGIDRGGGDRDRLDLQVPGHDDLHHPAAGRGLDGLVLELLLGGDHVLLHLLDLLEHLVHVGRLGHQAAPSGSGSSRISSAANSALRRSIRSASGSAGAVSAAAGASSSSRASTVICGDTPVRPRTASASAWRARADSALRRRIVSSGRNAIT